MITSIPSSFLSKIFHTNKHVKFDNHNDLKQTPTPKLSNQSAFGKILSSNKSHDIV